jgi:hypothetical protein
VGPWWAIVAEVDDPKAANFKHPNGVDLTKLLTPGVRVLSGKPDRRNIADSLRARVPQNERVLRPWNRPAHRFTAVVVVMWVGNQDGVGMKVWRKIISQPNATCIRIE